METLERWWPAPLVITHVWLTIVLGPPELLGGGDHAIFGVAALAYALLTWRPASAPIRLAALVAGTSATLGRATALAYLGDSLSLATRLTGIGVWISLTIAITALIALTTPLPGAPPTPGP